MSDRCPKCGGGVDAFGKLECGTLTHPDGTIFETGKQCLRRQLAEAQEELAEMQEVWHEDNQALGEAIIEIADLQAHNVQLSWVLERIGNLCRDKSDSGMTARQLGSEIVGLVDEALSSSPVNPYVEVMDGVNSTCKCGEQYELRPICATCEKRFRRQLAQANKRAERAERSLRSAGFEDHGGEYWTPPVNKDAGELWRRVFRIEAHNAQLSWVLEQIGALCRENSDPDMVVGQPGKKYLDSPGYSSALEALKDFAHFGGRFDTNPTLKFTVINGEPHVPVQTVYEYLKRIDEGIKQRACQALENAIWAERQRESYLLTRSQFDREIKKLKKGDTNA